MKWNPDYIRTLSLNQAENQLDGEALRKYNFAWTWSAGRLSEPAGSIQERYYNRHGRVHFWRRINQVRRICGCEELQITGVNK